MNFSSSKNFFTRNFSKGFYNNKFSFKMMNCNFNSSRFLINMNNKFYTTSLSVLNDSCTLKSKMLPSLMNSCGTTMLAADFCNIEDGVLNLLSGNGKFLFLFLYFNNFLLNGSDYSVLNDLLLNRDGKILNKTAKCLQMVRLLDNGLQ
jgi:hypothetical protein